MKNSLLLLFFTFSTQIITAQNVKFQLNDNQTKDPIEFATILLPDYKKSLTSNEKGLFILDAQKYKFPLKVIIHHFLVTKKRKSYYKIIILYKLHLLNHRQNYYKN